MSSENRNLPEKQAPSAVATRRIAPKGAKRDKYIKLANNIIYTGELDRFFNYCIGELSWRSINFIIKDESNHTSSLIGTPVLNFADTKLNWHRIIEHKWFTPERLNDEVFKNHTIVTYECGEKWEQGKEAFYPILTN